MATIKVSGLAAKNTLGGSEEILINDGGVSKKSTVAGITLAGEVTGAVTGVVIASGVVDEANLKVSNNPTNGYVLTAQSGNTGGLTWAQDSTTDNTKLPLAGGTMTGIVNFNDSVRARFGTSGDMSIFHDGSNSYIENTGDGDLIIQDQTGDVYIKGKSGENSIVANNDGSVDLYHDNTKKFETIAAGVDVTGNVVFGANSHGLIEEDGAVVRYKNTGTGTTHLMSHDGNEDITLNASGFIQFEAAGAERMRIDASGNVGIGTTSPASELHIAKSANGGNTELILENTYNASSSTDESIQIQGRFGGYDASYIVTGKEEDWSSSATRSSYMAFTTRKDGTLAEKVRINSSGNLGIGTVAPNYRLHVDATANDVSLFQGANSGSLTLRNATANEMIIHTGTSDALIIGTSGNTERMRINAAGQVLIGTTAQLASSAEKLTVYSSGTGHTRLKSSSDSTSTLYIENTSTTANTNQPAIIMTAGGGNRGGLGIRYTDSSMWLSGQGGFRFWTGASVGGGTEKMTITSAGNVGIGTASPEVGTNQTSLTVNAVSYPNITLKYGGNSTGAFAGSSVGVHLQAEGNRTLRLRTNDSDRLTVTGAGNVGIGESSPDNLLHITSAGSDTTLIKLENTNADPYSARMTFVRSSASVATDDDIGKIDFYAKDSAGNSDRYALMRAKIKDKTSGSEDGALIFSTVVGGSNVDTMQVSGGRVAIGTTQMNNGLNLPQGTNDSSRIGWSDSGGTRRGAIGVSTSSDDMEFRIGSSSTLKVSVSSDGLLFNGDTAAANALDDYEEGNWTPVFEGSSGTSGQAYETQTGRYTKIGRQVFCTAYLALTNKGTMGGVTRISDFPFTVSPSNISAASFAYTSNWSLTSGHWMEGWVYTTDVVYLFESNGSGSATQLTTSNFTANSRCAVSFTFVTTD